MYFNCQFIKSTTMWDGHYAAKWIKMMFIMSRLMTKPTKWHERQQKTPISLGIHLVWSVFSVRMKKAWVLSYPLSTQRRHWSDSDWQAHMPFCWFCHEPALLLTFISGYVTSFKTSKSWQFDVCCKQKIYATETKVIPQMGSSASHFPSSRHCNDGWPSR